MLRVKRGQLAFTLIELLVVVIIVAILAAVGIPMLSGNAARARATEAETGLGTIRTAVRAYLAENSTLPATLTLSDVNLAASDLDGHFFSGNIYKIVPTGAGATTYCLTVDGGAASNSAPAAGKVTTLKRGMDELGTIRDVAACTGGNILNN